MSKKKPQDIPQAEPQGDNVTQVQDEVLNTEEQETVEAQQDIEKEIETLREKCADLADKNLRMMAEFDNYRRRTNKEKLELLSTAGERIFKDMLPLIDDFERARQAMQTTEDIQAVREGIDLIYQKFIGFLEKNDVKQIPTENADFDTEYHEAITTFPAPTAEQKGKVIDCTQKGYTLGEKVIRYAKVVVGE
ncbi:MAG: nucleotide exchange factor GrpE [Paludibacteraceae bacterium]|nr:nucleotide exchange factor GrpE [Paludibacteraceae bacterium]